MKSMSISAHGRETFAWVWKCTSGLRSASRPPIHIFAGENVCIQAITPTQESDAVASRHARRMSGAVVSTGFHTIGTEMSPEASSVAAISWDCRATWSRVSSPYNDWLPVRNQISSAGSLLMGTSILAIDGGNLTRKPQAGDG